MNDQHEPSAYVLMECNYRNSYDGWWHPAGIYTDLDAAKAAEAEALRRIPDLELSIEKVPLNKPVSPAPWPDGRVWVCGFSYQDDGCWQWDPGIFPLEGDELADQTEAPYDLYQMVAVGEATIAYYGDVIHVLASDKYQAAERAKPLVAAYVTEQTGKLAYCEGYA